MLTPHKLLAAGLVLAVGALVAGCDHAPVAPESTARPVPTQAAPDVETHHGQFQMPYPGVDLNFACLPGKVHISGEISGWYEAVVMASGEVNYIEYDDFSQLTGSLVNGTSTWHVMPGSHTIWNYPIHPDYESGTTFVHETVVRLEPDDDADPMLRFTNNNVRVWLPGGDLLFNHSVKSADCQQTGD